MKRFFFNVLSLGLIAGLVLTSCEDEFTEEQALEQQRTILEALNNADNANDLAVAELNAENAIALAELDAEQMMAFQMYQDSLERLGPVVNYSVTVLAAGTVNTNARTEGEAFAPGATVTVVQGGVSRTETAGDGGVATFGDLRIGDAIVTVSAPDHTTVTYTTSLGGTTTNVSEDNVETTIPLFPTTVAAGASEVSGTVYAQIDATTEDAEVVEGAVVRSTISVSGALGAYNIFVGSNKGQVSSASYTDFTQIDTTDANGMYSFVVPNGLGNNGSGIGSTIEFLPYEADQTFVDEVEDGERDTLAVVTRRVRFTSENNGNSTQINVGLPSVWADIASPEGDAPTGFELGSAVRSTPITSSTFRLVDGGSDYVVGDMFTFPTGVDNDEKAIDEFAYLEVTAVDADGMITNWSFGETAPVGYITDPGEPTAATADEITQITSGTVPAGTGASFELLFEANYDLFIANGGSGYTFPPNVSFSAQKVINQGGGSVIATVGDTEIASGAASYNMGAILTEAGEIVINSTVIEANLNNGDTIRVGVGPFASAPTFVVKPIDLERAIIDPDRIFMNADGEITSVDFASGGDQGSGYGSQPTITFKSVNGQGSGATGVVNINNGSVTNITITNGGSGYLDGDDNDNRINFGEASPTNVDNDITNSSSSSFSDLKPGTSSSRRDFYYGAGVVIE